MARYYQSKEFNPLLYFLEKNHYGIVDASRCLNCTTKTFRSYIENSSLMRLRDCYILAGMFGMRVEVLVYILSRNKTQIRPKDKVDKWYIEEGRLEGEKILASLPREIFGDSPEKG